MTVDADTLIKTLTLLMAAGTGLYAWVMSQGKAAMPELEKLRAEMAKLSDQVTASSGRLTKVEGEMAHLPDRDMVHRIELGMRDMQARIDAQAEVVKAVERTMNRVETFLLEAQNRPVAPARARGK